MTDSTICPFCGEKLHTHTYSGVNTSKLIGVICDKCRYQFFLHESQIKLHARPGDTFTGPNGEKLIAVPVEPTKQMMESAGAPVDGDTQSISIVYDIWNDMLASVKGKGNDADT